MVNVFLLYILIIKTNFMTILMINMFCIKVSHNIYTKKDETELAIKKCVDSFNEPKRPQLLLLFIYRVYIQRHFTKLQSIFNITGVIVKS